jgi:hypothetical protein
MLLRLVSLSRGLKASKLLRRVIAIGFVEVDRVMRYGETKSVFVNK